MDESHAYIILELVSKRRFSSIGLGSYQTKKGSEVATIPNKSYEMLWGAFPSGALCIIARRVADCLFDKVIDESID